METIIKTTFRHYRFPPVRLIAADEITGRHGTAIRYPRNKTVRPPWTPDERGGYTTCTLEVTDDGISSRQIIGVSACSPRDGFCYQDGRELAHFDALKQLYNWTRIVAHPKERAKPTRRKYTEGEVKAMKMGGQARKAGYALKSMSEAINP